MHERQDKLCSIRLFDFTYPSSDISAFMMASRRRHRGFFRYNSLAEERERDILLGIHTHFVYSLSTKCTVPQLLIAVTLQQYHCYSNNNNSDTVIDPRVVWISCYSLRQELRRVEDKRK